MKNNTYILSVLILLLMFTFEACSEKKEKPQSEEKEEPLNIILMIGDGMGISQISTAFYFGDSIPNFEQFSSIGFVKTSSTSHTITDSAAGASAYATGEKTYNRAIGVSKDTVALPTILEDLKDEGYGTGLVSLTTITHATQAAFYAHVKDRDMHEDIAMDMANGKVDFFAGGGLKYFADRSDGKNLYQELEQKNYHMDSLKLSQPDPNKKNGYLLADESLPSKVEGRKDFLQDATRLALDYFDAKKEPFFLMVEGSYIDWAGHANDDDMMIQEVLDFDKTLGIVLDYVKKNPNTLLVVTADHETGGTSVGKHYEVAADGKKTEVPEKVAIYFNTDQHTGELIPVFAKGKGEQLFSGIYENSMIYHKLKQILKQ
ncbi:alkaline phosphatase [Galbibacter sp. EGI 63066]|uniref:alkaline phosphatase n=1 Tax=Galbibacter sp. EGI 63066 TaxID=2993559 RepID=UPI002248F739|nr:alkaline phosphatase [Galbibacter sp. EGI 63066]MCX2679452.1 alkaline phosphatase [Galbibacter sp. EGI 63066]